MRGYLNNLSRFTVAAWLVTVPLCAPHAAEVKGVRIWAAPDYTRLVLDAAGPLKYTISKDGDHLSVDLDDSHVGVAFSDPEAHGLYRGMSHARQGDHLRLDARIDPNSRLKSFVLKPASVGADYRLVLDLYPSSGTAQPLPSHNVQVTEAPIAAIAQAAPAAPITPSTADDADGDAATITPVDVRHRRGGNAGSAREAAVMLDAQRKVVVAIDAGHGGKDSGAHGPDGTLEKNVTLSVAKDLAAQINRQPGMKAVLTRDGDYFIELKQRYQIARDNKADLFISIHADSYTSDDAKGSSVWVLSSRGKTNEAARVLADRENADLIGGTTLDDKDDGLAKVLLDLQQSWAIQASDVVAGNVLKALGQLGPTHRGYVEQANFVVLRSPDVPSILVETAFISNPLEERKLRDPTHQNQLADAVMSGVKGYFEASPQPGTWFAAQAAQRNGGSELASARRSNLANRATADVTSPPDANVRDLHKVGPGESLRSIARQYGISVGALKNANQISSDSVRAGTMLAIPTS